MGHNSSLRPFLATICALTIFITECPKATSEKPTSEWNVNNEIRRQVNDGFTITKKDKEFFEQMNDGSKMTSVEEPRIVKGEEAGLGT